MNKESFCGWFKWLEAVALTALLLAGAFASESQVPLWLRPVLPVAQIVCGALGAWSFWLVFQHALKAVVDVIAGLVGQPLRAYAAWLLAIPVAIVVTPPVFAVTLVLVSVLGS